MPFDWKGVTTNDSMVVMNEEKYNKNKDITTKWTLVRADIVIGDGEIDTNIFMYIRIVSLILSEEEVFRLNANASV